MKTPTDAVVAVSGAAEAFARALTRCPEAQVERARTRGEKVRAKLSFGKAKRAERLALDLAEADRNDDEGAATAAVLALVALGVDFETIWRASKLGERIAIEDTERRE